MAKYQRFEDLPAWKEAAKLYNQVLDFFELPNVKLAPGFRNQLDRAALSVGTHIAAGFERYGMKDLVSCLDLARESAIEVRSMIACVIERDACKAGRDELAAMETTARNCSRQLGGWIEALRHPGSGPRQSDRPEPAQAESGAEPAKPRGDRLATGTARNDLGFRNTGGSRTEAQRPRTA